MDTKTVPAGKFKQGCLRILDQVSEKRVEVVITKRGKPVARLVPMDRPEHTEQAILADLRSKGRLLAAPKTLVAPTERLAGWKRR